MATDRHARGVGQRRLEEPPAPVTPEDAPVLPAEPAAPAAPRVPAEGSSAALRRRQAAWEAERERFEASHASADPGAGDARTG
jgi:hypothetical protein